MRNKILKDNLLTTRFGKPIEVEKGAAVALTLIRLLLLEPGENQSHPDMGVGIIAKHRFGFAEDLKSLETLIINQFQTYLPSYLKDASVKLTYNEEEMNLGISIDVTGFVIKMDVKENVLLLRDISSNS